LDKKKISQDTETRLKKLVSIGVILAFSAIAACGGASGGDPSNPLIGKWKLYAAAGTTSSPYCLASFEYAAKTFTKSDGNGKLATIPVTYVTSGAKVVTFPATVYVMSDAGILAHTIYIFSTKDKMLLDTALQCTYMRQ
jgi:hypothetical protein